MSDGRYSEYSEYKTTGTPWLESVPASWEMFDGKRIFESCRESAHSADEQLAASQKFGVVPQSLMMELNEAKVMLALKGTSSFRHVEKNDYVISLRSFEGGIEYSAYSGCVSPAYTVLRPTKPTSSGFYKHLFKSRPYISALQATTDSLRDGKAINYEQFGAIPLVLPPVPEQTQIAAFLDHETAKIDRLIKKQEALIALLKEKRQAVISHAVTKGLNPDAPLKDSGIEWLGQVPAHWEIGKVKTYFETRSGGTPNTERQDIYYSDEESGIPWVRTTDLQNDILNDVEIFITKRALSDTACSILPVGTVMVAMYGGDGTVGKNGLLAIPAAINQAVCGLLPAASHNSEYVFRFMQFYRPHWMVGAESSRKDPNISQERVKNAPLPQPPRKEQEAISIYLDLVVEKFDTLSVETQRAIELLHERRTALISAAVTGKIDVRAWQPPFPPEAVA